MVSDSQTIDDLRTQALRKMALEKLRSQPMEKIYRQDKSRLIEVPSGMSDSDIAYFDDTENLKIPKSDFFGKQFVRGAAQTLISAPATIGAGQRMRFADIYEKERSQEFSPLDLLDAVNPFVPISKSMAAQDKVLEKIGVDRKNIAPALRVNAQTLLNNNRKYLKDSGLTKETNDGIWYDLGAGATSLLSAVGLTFATKNPSAATLLFSELQRTDLYLEAREAGFDVSKSTAVADIGGTIEGGLEFLGGKVLLDAFGANRFVRRLAIRTANEAIQEGAQQASEETLTQVTGVREKDVAGAAERVAYSAMLGALLGGPTNLIIGSVETMAQENGLSKETGRRIAEKVLENKPDIENEFKNILDSESNEQEANPESLKVIEDFLSGEDVGDNQDLKEPTAEEFLNQYMANEETVFAKPKNKYWQNFKKATAEIAEPISSRIRKINEPLMYRLRRFELDTKVKIQEGEKSLVPFLKKWKSLDKKEQQKFDIILKNGTPEMIQEYAQKHNMEQEINDIRAILDDIYDRAQQANVDINYRSDFFPRHVIDPDGLIAFLEEKGVWNPIEKAIKLKEKKIGRELSDIERVDIANTLLRGFKVQGISLKDSGVFQERTIEEITPELNKFYNTTDQALLRYIVIANENIETKNLFGKTANTEDMQSVESSVGAMVSEMVKNKEITVEQASELKEIFSARFNRGQMGAIAEGFKNIAYIETMGSNIGSTLTQIGDLSFSIMKNGLFNTALSWPSAWTKKEQSILDDIGITSIAQEFQNGRYTSKAVDRVFKLTGLHTMDRVGKTTLVNAGFKRLKSQANKNDAKLKQQLEYMFGEGQSKRVLNDLKNNKITEDVKFLLFNELLEMQPVALSEMPAKYLTAKTGKIFYILKSFTIKQIDVYRREGTSKMIKGMQQRNINLFVEGFKNLTTLAGFLTLFGIGREYLWDSLTGREPEELEDYVIENIWKAFGLNQYSIDQLTRGYGGDDLGESVFKYALMPPTKTLDNLWRDVSPVFQNKEIAELKDLRVMRSIPVGGELYWFWFGGGSKSSNDKKETTSNTIQSIVK